MFPTYDWVAGLSEMLRRQDPESLHLDYKGRDSLLPKARGASGIDRQKRARDVSKDVSSFLNSDGGTLVYGIREQADPQSTGGAPVPISAFDQQHDGYDRGDIGKEDIENLITSNIQPRPGPALFRVSEVELQRRLIFVVEVATGTDTAYQAKDLRYYRRFHYKAEPMEHYEIEMVRARSTAPQLEVVAGLTATWDQGIREVEPDGDGRLVVPIHLGVRNKNTRVAAEAALVEIGVFAENRGGIPGQMLYASDRRIRYVMPPDHRHAGFPVDEDIAWFHIRWNPSVMGSVYQPLFSTLEPIHAAQFDFVVRPEGHRGIAGTWCWRIQAPNMRPTQSLMALVYSGFSRLRLELLDWPFQLDIGQR